MGKTNVNVSEIFTGVTLDWKRPDIYKLWRLMATAYYDVVEKLVPDSFLEN